MFRYTLSINDTIKYAFLNSPISVGYRLLPWFFVFILLIKYKFTVMEKTHDLF